jgi:hypothetical protein
MRTLGTIGVLIGAAALVLAVGCESKPPAAAVKHDVEREVLGFAINVPAGWTWRDLEGDVVLEIYKPATAALAAPGTAGGSTGTAAAPTGTATPTGGTTSLRPGAAEKASAVVVHVAVIDRDRLTLDEWADQTIKSLAEIQPGTKGFPVETASGTDAADEPPNLEVTAREKTKLADGREALRISLLSRSGAEPLVQELLLTQTGPRAYAVIATGPKDGVADVRAAAKVCFNSLVVW